MKTLEQLADDFLDVCKPTSTTRERVKELLLLTLQRAEVVGYRRGIEDCRRALG